MSHPQPLVEDLHLTDYINIIMRRRRAFLLSFLVIFIFVALYTFLMKPIFEASSTLYVKDEKGNKGKGLGDLSLLSVSNPVDSEIEILKSRTIAEQVVKRLHLDWVISNKSAGLEVKIVEFSSSSSIPEYVIEIVEPGVFKIVFEDGSPKVTGRMGELLKTNNLTLLISDIKGKSGDKFRLKQAPLYPTADSLRRSIKASEVGKKTNIVKVVYSSTSPVKARDVVNTLVQVYLDQTVSFRAEEASRTIEFVEGQLKGTRDELDQSEKNLQVYKSNNGVVKLETETEELVRKISDIEKDRASVILSRKQVEFALNTLQESRRKGQIYTPAVLKDDPLYSTMANRLIDLEVQRRALISENTENHPQVKVIQVQIDQLQRKLQSTYETSRANLLKQENSILQQIEQYEAKMRTVPATERDLARLLRVSKVNVDIYMFLLQKHEEARIAKASTISNINVVDPAITPIHPVKPQKRKNLVLGLLVGIMVGCGRCVLHGLSG